LYRDRQVRNFGTRTSLLNVGRVSPTNRPTRIRSVSTASLHPSSLSIPFLRICSSKFILQYIYTRLLGTNVKPTVVSKRRIDIWTVHAVLGEILFYSERMSFNRVEPLLNWPNFKFNVQRFIRKYLVNFSLHDFSLIFNYVFVSRCTFAWLLSKWILIFKL